MWTDHTLTCRNSPDFLAKFSRQSTSPAQKYCGPETFPHWLLMTGSAGATLTLDWGFCFGVRTASCAAVNASACTNSKTTNGPSKRAPGQTFGVHHAQKTLSRGRGNCCPGPHCPDSRHGRRLSQCQPASGRLRNELHLTRHRRQLGLAAQHRRSRTGLGLRHPGVHPFHWRGPARRQRKLPQRIHRRILVAGAKQCMVQRWRTSPPDHSWRASGLRTALAP